ncbi:MAG TPA: SAM-dependent methyltransferase [Verrucomicrobiae bacterium]
MPTDAIREEILKSGAISFARFMELALYCPETGYYERNQDNVGRAGDFITSVSAGSLFGELLAFQLAEWLGELKIQNEQLKIVEAGAHDGKLAADILNWLQLHRPELFEGVEYVILEPSARRQSWQREKLKSFPNVRWFTDCENLKLKTQNPKLHGVIFGNELLDAFPVRRFGWDAKSKNWFECGVTLDGGKFIWERTASSAFDLPLSILNLPSALLEVLPDGYTIEISPAAETWWREAAGILAHGKLLAIDYGFTAEEQFLPSRLNGTLRAYHRHRVGDDLLANVGEQDLTAHVNFSAIQKAGEEAGLRTETFCTQPQFLTRILQKAVTEKSFATLDAKQIRQFQTLTHPEHLGRAFRVLVQGR